jgi:periplasmic copper chaperone A
MIPLQLRHTAAKRLNTNAWHAALFCGVIAAITPARAHVTLDTAQAPALGYVRIAARVPHGCEGAATVALRLQIPDGVTAVKPQPKPGWTLQVVTDPAAPVASGHEATPSVREVLWRAQPGQALPDAFYEEFVLRVRMPDAAGQTIWFPFVQECEGGKVSRWIERPAEGQTYEQLRTPAYPVRIVPRS